VNLKSEFSDDKRHELFIERWEQQIEEAEGAKNIAMIRALYSTYTCRPQEDKTWNELKKLLELHNDKWRDPDEKDHADIVTVEASQIDST